MRVLVTGAGSMLLGGVARALSSRGDEVICLQRREIIFESSLNIKVIQGDIRDADAVMNAAAGCDAIVHGAAMVGVVGKWNDFRDINVDGTRHVIHAAQAHNIQRLVYVSTPSVAHVGSSLVGCGATPAVLSHGRALYAQSKALAEIEALAANSDELGVVALRPHLVWGPGDTQLVGRIIERATTGKLAMVGNGAALIDSTYIDNAISAHVAALDAVSPKSICAGKAYVISNGEPRPVAELLQGICMAAGVPFSPKKVPYRLALAAGTLLEQLWPLLRRTEPPLTRFVAEQLGTAHWFDSRPARHDLAWSPLVSIDEGFALLKDNFRVK
jgi:nucleoside-diphosphate-sugar epimerase